MRLLTTSGHYVRRHLFNEIDVSSVTSTQKYSIEGDKLLSNRPTKDPIEFYVPVCERVYAPRRVVLGSLFEGPGLIDRDFAIVELDQDVCPEARPIQVKSSALKVGTEIEMLAAYSKDGSRRVWPRGTDIDQNEDWFKQRLFFAASAEVLMRGERGSTNEGIIAYDLDTLPGSSGAGLLVEIDGVKYVGGINIQSAGIGKDGDGFDWNLGIEITEGSDLDRAISEALERELD